MRSCLQFHAFSFKIIRVFAAFLSDFFGGVFQFGFGSGIQKWRLKQSISQWTRLWRGTLEADSNEDIETTDADETISSGEEENQEINEGHVNSRHLCIMMCYHFCDKD